MLHKGYDRGFSIIFENFGEIRDFCCSSSVAQNHFYQISYLKKFCLLFYLNGKVFDCIMVTHGMFLDNYNRDFELRKYANEV